jgi:hypothetical protein
MAQALIGKSTARKAKAALDLVLSASVGDVTGTVEALASAVDQFAPEIFDEPRTPEQDGGRRAMPMRERRIDPGSPDTWNGLRLIDKDTVELKTSNFRARYKIGDPEITGQMVQVQSSNVHSIGLKLNLKYPLKSELHIRFLQGGRTGKVAGPLYAYRDFSPILFRRFMNAISKGTFVWDEIRIRGTVSGSQYQYTLIGVTGGNVPRRAIIINGIQILKRRMKTSTDGTKTVQSKLQSKVIGPYRPKPNRKGGSVRPNVGNPNRARPNRGR